MVNYREIIFAAFLALVAILGFSAYQRSKDREQYAECLRVTERLLEADRNRIGIPYCRL